MHARMAAHWHELEYSLGTGEPFGRADSQAQLKTPQQKSCQLGSIFHQNMTALKHQKKMNGFSKQAYPK